LLPNSTKVSPEGAFNNKLSFEIGSSTPLEESILIVNPLLSVVRDPLLLRINSLGDIVIEYYTEIPTGPHAQSGVGDMLFQSETFRTLVHTAIIFNLSSFPIRSLWRTSSGHDIFDKLGMSPNQPMGSHMPLNFTAYTVPLDHFTSTANNVVTISDQLLVGSHTILPLELANSTMVPQATHVSFGSAIIIQAPIGTPLSLRSNLTLPLGHNTLNTSIYNPAQNPSRGSNINIFVPPGYNAASSFVPAPTQVLSGGPSIPPPPSPGGYNHPSLIISNQIGGTSHSVTSGFQIPIGG
jgi:hypothetical protein